MSEELQRADYSGFRGDWCDGMFYGAHYGDIGAIIGKNYSGQWTICIQAATGERMARLCKGLTADDMMGFVDEFQEFVRKRRAA
jgi:hypothetical protein